MPELYLIYDRSETDLISHTYKAYHNTVDMIRIATAINQVAAALDSYGYNQTVSERLIWNDWDYTEINLEHIRSDIQTFIYVFTVNSDTPALPGNLDHMTIDKANAIEKILYDLNVNIQNMIDAFIYSGEIYSGEGDYI